MEIVRSRLAVGTSRLGRMSLTKGFVELLGIRDIVVSCVTVGGATDAAFISRRQRNQILVATDLR